MKNTPGRYNSTRHYLECEFSRNDLRRFYALLLDNKRRSDCYGSCSAKAKARAHNEPDIEFVLDAVAAAWEWFNAPPAKQPRKRATRMTHKLRDGKIVPYRKSK